MKQAILNKNKNFQIIDLPEILPSEKEVVVKIKYCGICGSDIHIIEGSYKVKYPCALGHEIMGEIYLVGNKVKGLSKGDRVVVIPVLNCGDCKFCKIGEIGLCEKVKYVGCDTKYAGFADFIAIDSNKVIKIPDTVDDVTASLIEPACIALHAIEKFSSIKNKNFIIFGAGTLGISAFQIIKYLGAKNIILFDLLEYKILIADFYGAKAYIFNEKNLEHILNNIKIDCFLDTVFSTITLKSAIKLIEKKGEIVLLGMAGKNIEFDKNDAIKIVLDEICIKGSAMYKIEDFNKTINIFAEKKIFFDLKHIKIFKFEEINSAFQFLRSSKNKFLKILIKL